MAVTFWRVGDMVGRVKMYNLGFGLLATVDWHLISYVSVPIGLSGTAWAYKSLREIGQVEGGRLDWPGNILFGVGLVAVLAGITDAIQPYGSWSMGWLNPQVLGLLIGGVVLLAAFVAAETKVAQPMFNMGLFRIRAFAAGNIASLLASAGISNSVPANRRGAAPGMRATFQNGG